MKMRQKLAEKMLEEKREEDNTLESEVEFTKDQKELIELHEYLASLDPEGAPLVSVLEAWKAKHKSIFVSKVSNTSVQPYIFTTLKRADFKSLQASGVFDNEEKGNEVLVEKCLLYPAPTQAWRVISDAGIITTLARQITYKSGFVPEEEALSLIKII